MALKGFIAILTIVLWGQLAYSETLTLSDCAANCTSDITSRFSGCKFGIQCFCTDPPLFDLGKQCWESNCTVREALTAENVTSISCNFPDRDRGPASSAVTFTSMAVALCLVATRIVAMSPDFRVLWGWDDVLVGLATLLMIGNAVCNPISRHYGYGRDTWRLPFDDTRTVEMIFYIGGVLYAVGIASTKVAFLVFYIKLFSSRIFRWVAFPLLVATVLHGLTFTFLFIFQCSPVSYAWTQWDGTGQGKCLNFDLGAVMHAITNILLDLLIFALPIWQLWSLSLSKRKKFQVISMFCVGFL
ncbi:hypothetical protein G647_03311 [Cladophialophora carrionii CBS 160.54]|uniref:Uncharacterized protein n=1 Tax=Cladophialophora carrionii CBS 160.54 TaxID=1279043 RepID=V9DI08_9EURO|nr:uncharacterized protein G647_03311 [Cladophialophora carrionii CBS 160.54]ETI26534.1 hypothetical protein G647_03311 [Cladophialophora carrionii CBS 160.54]